MCKSLLAVLFLLLGFVALAIAEENANALDKPVAGGWKFASFDEAVQQMELTTGLSVSVDREVRAFLQSIRMKEELASRPEIATTVRRFLDRMASRLCLRWQLDEKTNVVTLDLPWKITDPRPASELLKAVRQPGYWTDYEKDPKWQTAFNALISQEGNFAKAWHVRQKACFQKMIRAFDERAYAAKPMLMKQIVDAGGTKYVLIMLEHPIEMYPGSGSVSYYWFTEEGTLAGADLMNTGHRCKLVDSTIDNEVGAHTKEPSKIQMILKRNERDFFIASFVLDDHGLKLNRLMDAEGKDVGNDGIHVGQSLMEPDGK